MSNKIKVTKKIDTCSNGFFCYCCVYDENTRQVGELSAILYIDYSKSIVRMGEDRFYKVETDDFIANFMSNIKDVLVFDLRQEGKIAAYVIIKTLNNIEIREKDVN